MNEIIVEIPEYIRYVTLSNKTRPIYYEWNGQYVTRKKKSVPIPMLEDKTKKPTIDNIKAKYFSLGAFYKNNLVRYYHPKDTNLKNIDIVKSLLIEEGYIKRNQSKDIKFYIIDFKTKERIISNKAKVGKPNSLLIRGQDIYSSNYDERIRAKIMNEIKNSFLPYVKNIPVIEKYPVMVEMELHDTVKNIVETDTQQNQKSSFGVRWDVGNRSFPYAKAFLDLLVNKDSKGNKIYPFESKLIDDDRFHVTADPQGGIFCPLPNNDSTKRKLVFKIKYDDRDIIKNNIYYKQYHNQIFTISRVINENNEN